MQDRTYILLMKLHNSGVGGTFLKLIKSMYRGVYYRLKINGGLTPSFPSIIGVRQGCVMSPLLFKIFIADLPSIFDERCHPISFQSVKLSCLSYADDLVLLSESKDGLQRCIDKLSAYCYKWNLKINIVKTQVIVFNSKGVLFDKLHFFLDDDPLKV